MSFSEYLTRQSTKFLVFFFFSGKIKVKIVTSKEALENLDIDNDKDVKLLSEKEETQFRDMILNLLVSSDTNL